MKKIIKTLKIASAIAWGFALGLGLWQVANFGAKMLMLAIILRMVAK